MSYFSYGATAGTTDPTQGVVMSYVLSQGMSDTPIMSDDGTEYLYTERTINVRGVLNTALAPATGGETPSATYARIKRTLQTPRLQLFFYHNTAADPSPLCQSPQVGYAVDARYGPICKSCRILPIKGSECLFVELEYVTWVLECVGTSPYISHRWTESVTLDEGFYTTKSRTGKIVVRADGGPNPDTLRGLVSPPIDPGFKRTKSEYTMQSDGLALMYSYTDEEQYLQPPLGSIHAEGEYTESTADGGQRWGECRVKLKGPKSGLFSAKADLMKTAILICVQKLELGGLKRSPEGAWLAIGGVREALWANEVEVRIKTIIQPMKTSKTAGTAVDLSRFGKPLYGVDSTTQLPPDLGSRGTALLGLAANALNDPCLGQSVLTAGGQTVLKAAGQLPTDPNAPNSTTAAFVLQTVPTLNIVFVDDETDYDEDEEDGEQGAYLDYKLRAQYVSDDHTVVLSTAMAGAPAAAMQLGQGTMGQVIEWEAERYNAWPQAPNTYINEPNIVFLRQEFNPGQIDVAGDGDTSIFRLSGRLYYAFLDRSLANLTAPVPPYLGSQVDAEADIPLDIFSANACQKNTSGGNVLVLNSEPPQTPGGE